jgi:hypothetical protein
MVSCTITFNKEKEGHDIEKALGMYLPVIKSVSMLPYSDENSKSIYPQMPYEGITSETYEKILKTYTPVDWSTFVFGDGQQPKYCTNDGCI